MNQHRHVVSIACVTEKLLTKIKIYCYQINAQRREEGAGDFATKVKKCSGTSDVTYTEEGENNISLRLITLGLYNNNNNNMFFVCLSRSTFYISMYFIFL